jgi:hypothetical protein
MLVVLIVETLRGDPPKDALEPLWNPVPVTVTEVPPALGPVLGVTEVTVGAATKVKQLLQVPLCVSALVTTTLTAPAACPVVVPLMLVAEIVEIVRADPPNDTVAPVWKPIPATVTDVPPMAEPLFGVTDVTVGAGAR